MLIVVMMGKSSDDSACWVVHDVRLYSVLMAGPCICVLCLADTCASEVHTVFNPVAPYGYLLPSMYLFIVDIANPDSFV